MATNDKTLYDFDPDAQPEDQQTITIAHVDDAYDHYGGRASYGRCMGECDPSTKGWLGNPYRVAEHGRGECIDLFESAFIEELKDSRAFCNAVVGLPGTVVACHCRHVGEDEPACHLDVVRERLLDGTAFCIADRIHGIPLPEWQEDAACDPEVLL